MSVTGVDRSLLLSEFVFLDCTEFYNSTRENRALEPSFVQLDQRLVQARLWNRWQLKEVTEHLQQNSADMVPVASAYNDRDAAETSTRFTKYFPEAGIDVRQLSRANEGDFVQ